jgi:hypothetical protein
MLTFARQIAEPDSIIQTDGAPFWQRLTEYGDGHACARYLFGV